VVGEQEQLRRVCGRHGVGGGGGWRGEGERERMEVEVGTAGAFTAGSGKAGRGRAGRRDGRLEWNMDTESTCNGAATGSANGSSSMRCLGRRREADVLVPRAARQGQSRDGAPAGWAGWADRSLSRQPAQPAAADRMPSMFLLCTTHRQGPHELSPLGSDASILIPVRRLPFNLARARSRSRR
jgi:hypothetical protein